MLTEGEDQHVDNGFRSARRARGRLESGGDRLPEVLERGLRELSAAEQTGFHGAAEVLEFLAGLPDPEEIIALRPSQALQERIDALLEKNGTTGLSETEAREWASYEYLEHLVRVAKAKAHAKLNAA